MCRGTQLSRVCVRTIVMNASTASRGWLKASWSMVQIRMP